MDKSIYTWKILAYGRIIKGDYGNERCIGIIKKNKSNSNVEVRCEHINQLEKSFGLKSKKLSNTPDWRRC